MKHLLKKIQRVIRLQAWMLAGLAVLWGGLACTSGKDKNRKTVPVAHVVPMTAANMRGHKMLYKEGWFIVTSTERSLQFAKEASIDASWEAIVQMARDVKAGTIRYGSDMKENARASVRLADKTLQTGMTVTRGVFAGTHYLGKTQFHRANRNMVEALDTFVKGNLSIVSRTEEDRQALAEIPGKWFENLREDFSNLYILSRKIKKAISKSIELNWNASFEKAAEEFRQEYEKSGTRRNSAQALGDILLGYLKAFYHGLAHPGARTIVKASAKGAKYIIFLPAASVLIVAGRTVQSTGLALFYTTKLGIHVISPNLETGMLVAFGLLGYGSVPVIYGTGTTLGAFSLAAFTAGAPVAGGVRAAGGTVVHTGRYAAGTVHDVVTGTTKVAINQLMSGLVLGYNALTAIPAHLYLGTVDAAVFLAWDGPRLVIAIARGTVSFTAKPGKKEKVSVGALPVGTVVDLETLKKKPGVQVEVLTTDPEIIQNVIQKMPDDLHRSPHEPPR